MLNYLQGYTQPEISMTVHQCAQFFNNLHLVHKCTVRRIPKYLIRTSTYVDLSYVNRRLFTCGVVYNPDKEKGVQFYVDADFSSGWSQADANNAENFLSRMGYVITYAGCPVLWCNKLQTEINLITTEA